MVKWTVSVLPAAAFLAACISVSFQGPAERAWADGDLGRAALAYEEVLAGEPGGKREARAMYRLALILSLPDGPRPDPRRATELLDRLLRENPGSRYAPQATLLLDLQRAVRRLEELTDTLATRADRLEREADREMRGLEQEMGRLQGEAEARQNRIKLLERQIGRLRGQLGELEAEMARLEEELRRLKQIDLEQQPP